MNSPFRITVEDIFEIQGRHQVITSRANAPSYRGRLQCDDVIISVIGYTMFPPSTDDRVDLLIEGLPLTQGDIGKTFTEFRGSLTAPL